MKIYNYDHYSGDIDYDLTIERINIKIQEPLQ